MNGDNLILGKNENAAVPLTLARAGSIAAHSCIIGQSGSGKSFFLARLIEEVVLRTKCQVVIVDPNGDFRRIGEVADSAWKDKSLGPRLERIGALAKDMRLAHREASEGFRSDWDAIPKTTFFGGKPPEGWPDGQLPFHVRWGSLYGDQELVHGIDHRTNPSLFRAYIAVNKMEHKRAAAQGKQQTDVTLSDLKSVALDVANGKIANTEIPHDGTGLSSDDWRVLALHLERLEKAFPMLAPPPKAGLPDLPAILKRRPASPKPGLDNRAFRICEIDLSDVGRNDRLLCLCTVIKTVMHEARREWRSSPNQAARAPTLIVIDEAQHFAPEVAGDELSALARERIAEVVAEGRKYGVFVILATQRPGKIWRGLLNEIDNLALLRLSSPTERQVVATAFGLPPETVDRASDLQPGHGLMYGKWSAIPMFTEFAPARIAVSGGNLDPSHWAPGLTRKDDLDNEA